MMYLAIMINLLKIIDMDKKEAVKELFRAMIKNAIGEEPHFFDENSEQCKNCNEFTICKSFAPISNKIKALKLDAETNEDIADFLDGIKHNYGFVRNNIDKPYTEMLKIKLYDIHQRFENVSDFKHYDILVNNLSKEELGLIRKVIIDTNNLIHNLLDKVIEANLKETNFMVKRLQVEVEEPKRYEDMTKEELIALLNNK